MKESLAVWRQLPYRPTQFARPGRAELIFFSLTATGIIHIFTHAELNHPWFHSFPQIESENKEQLKDDSEYVRNCDEAVVSAIPSILSQTIQFSFEAKCSVSSSSRQRSGEGSGILSVVSSACPVEEVSTLYWDVGLWSHSSRVPPGGIPEDPLTLCH